MILVVFLVFSVQAQASQKKWTRAQCVTSKSTINVTLNKSQRATNNEIQGVGSLNGTSFEFEQFTKPSLPYNATAPTRIEITEMILSTGIRASLYRPVANKNSTIDSSNPTGWIYIDPASPLAPRSDYVNTPADCHFVMQ
jgi:hypothetical protein